MKKVIQMIDLDCAHCASKMEQGIAKIQGVTSVNINFMTSKMTLECDEQAYHTIIDQAKKVCAKIEPDCKLKI